MDADLDFGDVSHDVEASDGQRNAVRGASAMAWVEGGDDVGASTDVIVKGSSRKPMLEAEVGDVWSVWQYMGHLMLLAILSTLLVLPIFAVPFAGPDDGFWPNWGWFFLYNPVTTALAIVVLNQMFMLAFSQPKAADGEAPPPIVQPYKLSDKRTWIFLALAEPIALMCYIPGLLIVGEHNLSTSYIMLWGGYPLLPVLGLMIWYRLSPEARASPRATEYLLWGVRIFIHFEVVFTCVMGIFFAAAWMSSGIFAVISALVIVPLGQFGLVRASRWDLTRAAPHYGVRFPNGGVGLESLPFMYGSGFLSMLPLIDLTAEAVTNPVVLTALFLSPVPGILYRQWWIGRARKKMETMEDKTPVLRAIRGFLIRRVHVHTAGICSPLGMLIVVSVVMFNGNKPHYYILECMDESTLPVVMLYALVQTLGELVAILIEMFIMRMDGPEVFKEAMLAFQVGCKRFDVLNLFLSGAVTSFLVSCMILKHDGIAFIGDLLPCSGK